MAQGFLVQLGNGLLGSGDTLQTILFTFNTATNLGNGSWTWSGTSAGGGTVTNQTANGVYWLATDGSVYFVPNTVVGTVTTAVAATAPAFDDRSFGTAANNTITGDGNSDFHYGGATTATAGTGNDTINADAGNDTVFGGDGDDALRGGGDNDSIQGGDGNDTIHGDSPTTVTGGAEDLNWSLQSGSVTGGFTQDTGGMRVTFAYNDDGAGTGADITNAAQFVGAQTFSTTSGLELNGDGNGNTSRIGFTFDADPGSGLQDQVSNVLFRINDIDHTANNHRDILTIRAWDINGNPVFIDLTAGGADTVTDGTTATIRAANGGNQPTEAAGSVLVSIAGPVHYIEIDYDNGLNVTQAIWLTDVQFTTLAPTDGNDNIDAGAGIDTVFGGGGNDTIIGGADADSIYGGAGNDSLQGDGGNDRIEGGADNDIITDNGGQNTFFGDAGDDTITATGGGDTAFGGDGNDNISLGANADVLSGDAGNDTLTGGGGTDSLSGGNGNDTLFGGVGTDTLAGDAGNDSVYGGDDADRILFADNVGNDLIQGGEGGTDRDTLVLTSVASTQGVNVQFNAFEAGTASYLGTTGVGTFSQIEVIEATAFADTINAAASSSNAHEFYAGAGNDTVFGGSGNDSISGGDGDDSVLGNAGDDRVDLGAGNDRFGTFGTDSAGNDTVDGGAGDDSIVGGAGNDSLTGGIGNDTLSGGMGTDTMSGGDGRDQFNITDDHEADVITGGEGPTDGDTIAFANFATTAGITVTFTGNEAGNYAFNATPSGFAPGAGTFTEIETINATVYDDTVNAAASNLAQTIVGNAGNDTLTGSAASDEIYGGADADILAGGSGNDSLFGGDGNDQIAGGAGNDALSGGNGTDTFQIGTSEGTDSVTGGENTGDADNLSFGTASQGVSVTFTGGEAGNFTSGTGTGTFSQIEVVTGSAFNDTLNASAATTSATLFGGAGTDSLTGGTGADSLTGGDGNDTLAGGAGTDTLSGGAGADLFIIRDNAESEVITGGEGLPGPDQDEVDFNNAATSAGVTVTFTGDEAGNFSFNATPGGLAQGTGSFAEIEAVRGTDFVDTINASAATVGTTIYAEGGADSVTGSGGADSIFGGSGADVINGGQGADSIEGGSGDDSIAGGTGNDTITGGDGNDTMSGGDGGDQITAGGTGDKVVSGGDGDDVIAMAAGADQVDGGAGIDQIFGGAGNDSLTGGDGADQISAGNDADNIYGGVGDFIVGGEGGTDNDTLYVTGVQSILYSGGNNEAGTITFVGGGTLNFSEIERVFIDGVLNVRDYIVEGGSGDDIIDVNYTGDPEGDRIDANDMTDGSNNDSVLGGGGNDTIFAWLGDDTIDGEGGRDLVYGEDGNDSIQGGAGNDTLDGGIGNDRIDGGTDDDVIFGGTGADSLTGGAGNDAILGGDDADRIDGGTGDDTLNAGSGDDSVAGGDGGDTLFGDAGADILQGDAGDDSLYGGDAADSLFGGTGNDAIGSGTGNDLITGGDGIDLIGGDAGDDSITGDAGADSLYGGTGNDQMSGGDDNDVVFGEIGNDTVTGGAGDDTVYGGWNNDLVQGDAGNDLVAGRAGDDTVEGGDGDDIVVGGPDTFDQTAASNNGTVDTQNVTLSGGEVMTGYHVGNGASANEIHTHTFAADPLGTVIRVVNLDPAERLVIILDGTPVDLNTAIAQGWVTVNAGSTPYSINGAGELSTASTAATPTVPFTITIDRGFTTLGIQNVSAGGGGGGTVYDLQPLSDIDTLFGGTGNDTLFGGIDTDTLYGGDGTDSLFGGRDEDTLFGGADNDLLDGGEGADSLSGGDGADSLTGGTGHDSLAGDAGADTLDGGIGNDILDGGAGNDRLTGGDGIDAMTGGAGDDRFLLGDGFGTDTITGGETAEVAGGDVLDASAITTDQVLDLSAGNAANPEDGTLTTTGGTATFAEIEAVALGSGDDSIIGSSGADSVSGGVGEDRFDGGAGNDRFDLGVDTDTDTLVLDDGDGDDVVINFTAPTPLGGGVFIPGDQIDVSALTDTQGNPVTIWDVVVTDDGAGNAILNFPNGESLTLIGVPPTSVTDPRALLAMGIPGSDGTVTGTGGDDLIDTSYIGDPDGDRVDAADNLGAGAANDDIIVAGAGNDSVLGGDGADSVFGGTGADQMDGGAGNDTLSGDAGTDTLLGGIGDDTLSGGGDADSLSGDGGNDSLAGGAGADSLVGGTGLDILSGGDDADSLFGGADSDTLTGDAGNDRLDGGAGADTMGGGDGDDRFILNNAPGNDVINGGDAAETGGDVIDAGAVTTDIVLDLSAGSATDPEDGTLSTGGNTVTFAEIESVILGSGDDSITGSTGADSVSGGAGNDTFIGGAGNDTFDGGTGNDTLDGGTGSDSLIGGDGNDTVVIAQGDTATGGDGDDLFNLADFAEGGTTGITIVGGEGNETTGDTLNLGTLADLSTLNITNTGAGGLSGTVLLDDGTLLTFSEIENIICFTPGTRIATPLGARAVETLAMGDLVVTRDHGLQPIRWIGSRTVPALGNLAPVRIRPGVVKGQERDLIVSPQHRMLFQGYRAELLFGDSEVLVAATHLVDGRQVTQDEGGLVTYVHILFDDHEVIFAEGAATESFHPGGVGLSAITARQREELFTLFPELRAMPASYGATARRVLKRHEAQLIRN